MFTTTTTEKIMAAPRISFMIGICLAIVVNCLAQTGKKQYFASKDDLPFIRCSVCQKALKEIRQEIEKMRKIRKVDEDEILNVVEKSCNPDSKQGDWISKYDIVESADGLNVIKQESSSRCKQECKTIAKACEESIDEIDTDLGEMLWKDELSFSKLINKVCYQMTNVCSKKIPKYVPGRRKDEVFKAMSEDEKKAFNMMKEMKSVPGMPGMEMYSKDDIGQMQDELTDTPSKSKEQEKKAGPQTTENEAHASHRTTNLGLLETLKATFGGFYHRAKNMFGFGNKKTEL